MPRGHRSSFWLEPRAGGVRRGSGPVQGAVQELRLILNAVGEKEGFSTKPVGTVLEGE